MKYIHRIESIRKKFLARISHAISSEDGRDGESGPAPIAREHCRTDKARATGGEDDLADRSDSPGVCEKSGLEQQPSVDALLIEEPIAIFYLTGMEVSTGSVLIDTREAHLLVDARYYEQATKRSPIPVILKKEDTLRQLLKQKTNIKTLGFHQDAVVYQRYREMQEQYDQLSLVPLANLVKQQRMVKDREEIQKLREAGLLGSRGYDYVCGRLTEGISEKEIASELEIFWLREGGEGLAFDAIIAFGSNTSMPHYRPSPTQKLKKGDPVLIDIGVSLEHYQSDMTRVIFFGGAPSGKMQEIYDVVKEAQKLALDHCKPGVTAGSMDAVAREYINQKGYGEFFSHGLGHGVGLEIHEEPYLRNKPPYANIVLKEGMVVTVEPGIYLPEVGGVRLENTVVVTKSGIEDLTQRKV